MRSTFRCWCLLHRDGDPGVLWGIHRYQLVWLYFRNKKNAAKWDEPGGMYPEGELPFVTIQLPIFNEQLCGGPD